jgi:hypothetical protein
MLQNFVKIDAEELKEVIKFLLLIYLRFTVLTTNKITCPALPACLETRKWADAMTGMIPATSCGSLVVYRLVPPWCYDSSDFRRFACSISPGANMVL